SPPSHTLFPYTTLFRSAALGLVMIVVRKWDSAIADLRLLAPLRACGRRCYSIYLTHLPICTIGCMVLFELGLTGFWTRAMVMVRSEEHTSELQSRGHLV